MNNNFLAILIFFLAVNLAAFIIMLVDKNKSRVVGAERISEGMLFFMATFFGSFGVFLGMLIFHHKTQKFYFILGIPMLILENCAFLYLLYSYI
jgi:uncharacterized membrane protein YsdA (DUF1294 family)